MDLVAVLALVTGRTVADGCRGLVTGFGAGAAFALAGEAGFFGAVLAFEGFAAFGLGFGAAAPWIESTPSMTGVPGSAEDVDERRLDRRPGATGFLPLKKPLSPVHAVMAPPKKPGPCCEAKAFAAGARSASQS